MRERLPARRANLTFEFDHRTPGGALQRYTATLGFHDPAMRRLGEVFLTCGRSGSDVDIATKDSAIALSVALQHGASLAAFGRAFLRAEGRPEGPLGTLVAEIAARWPHLMEAADE